MKTINIIILIVILFSMVGCDFVDYKLIVVNNSKDSIAFIIPAEPNYFPTTDDDSLENPRKNKRINDSLLHTIAKYDPKRRGFGGVHFLTGNSSMHVATFNIKWEDVINETPEKKIQICFIPTHIMTSGIYTWIEIYDKGLFIEKKKFSIDELEKLNWKVVYDGK